MQDILPKYGRKALYIFWMLFGALEIATALWSKTVSSFYCICLFSFVKNRHITPLRLRWAITTFLYIHIVVPFKQLYITYHFVMFYSETALYCYINGISLPGKLFLKRHISGKSDVNVGLFIIYGFHTF